MKAFIIYCRMAKKNFITNGGKKAWRALIYEALCIHTFKPKTK